MTKGIIDPAKVGRRPGRRPAAHQQASRIMHYAASFFVRSRGARAPPRPVTPSIEKIRTRNEHQKTGGDIRDPSRNDEGPDASRVF
jgi:hypothetical protein